MRVIYVDYRIVPHGDEEFISEFTWTREDDGSFDTRHYFVDYPGAKDLERMVTEVVGGEPLVRYSMQGVLRAFLNTVKSGDIIAFKDREHKNVFAGLLSGFDLECAAPTCSFDDVIAMDDEKKMIMWIIEEARTEAAKRFGNSL